VLSGNDSAFVACTAFRPTALRNAAVGKATTAGINDLDERGDSLMRRDDFWGQMQ
jgi:hypothetical protein